MNEELQKRMDKVLKEIESIINEIEEEQLYNTQEVLDWMDILNRYSYTW